MRPFFILNIAIGYAIAAWLLFVPWAPSLFAAVEPHDVARLAQLPLLLACAIHVCVRSSSRYVMKRSQSLFAVAVLGLACASVVLSDRPALAMREVALYVGLVAVAISAYDSIDDGALFPLVIAAAGVYAFLVLIMLVVSIADRSAILRDDIFVGYSNPRIFSHVAAVTLPLLVGATAAPASLLSSRTRAFAWATASCTAMLMAISYARSTVASLLMGAGLAALVLTSTRHRFLQHSLLIMGAGTLWAVLLGLLYPYELPEIASVLPNAPSELTNDHSRLYLWRLAHGYVINHPWLGVGPAHFALYPNEKAAHPHNIYLQLASEWGLPMACAVMGAAGWWILRAIKRVGSEPCADSRYIQASLLFAIFVVSIDSFFSGTAVLPVSQVWLACVIGWTGRYGHLRCEMEEKAVVPVSWSLLGAVFVLSQVALWWSVWPEAANLQAHLDAVSRAVDNARRNPRFWSHGWIGVAP